MKHGIYAPTFNDYGDPNTLVALAVLAEESGYDAFFIWDHLALQPDGAIDIVDATVVLGAIAQATERIRLGAMITPVARRRPWKLAKELATLDHLSRGRVTLGVGLGEPADLEFENFGEDPSAKTRAARLDEGLDLLDPLLRGERVDHDGPHYRVRNTRLAPACVQTPRLPIWAAASLPAHAGLRRAARLDGLFPILFPEVVVTKPDGRVDWSHWWLDPQGFGDAAKATLEYRAEREGSAFDLAATGSTEFDSAEQAGEKVRAYEAAGATWWLEWLDDSPGRQDEIRRLIQRGPPA